MSEIVFHCSKCGAKLSAGDDEAGEQFECPVCETMQTVPGHVEAAVPARPAAETVADTHAGGRVVRIPRKKIVLSSRVEEEEDEEEIEDLIEDEVAGSGLRVFAMAIGTGGVVLCLLAVVWVLVAQRLGDNGDREWWQLILTFTSIFLLAMMGLVLAGIAFRVERIAAHLALMQEDKD